jgi:hypothetical protein
MPRTKLLKIVDIRNLGKNEKKFLRDEIRKAHPNQLKFNASLKRMMEFVGETTERRFYQHLARVYNERAEEENERIIEQRKVKQQLKRREKRQNKKDETLKQKIEKINTPDLTKLRDALKAYKGKNIVVEYLIVTTPELLDDIEYAEETFITYDRPIHFYPTTEVGHKTLIRTREYSVPHNFRQWWKKVSHEWFYTYDLDIFTYIATLVMCLFIPKMKL